jgi:membrane protease YdiL (CAAX protease family)
MGMSGGRPGPKPWLVAASGALAAVLFIALFRFRRLGPIDFWAWLAMNITLVAALGFAVDKGYGPRVREDLRSGLLRKIGIGVLSALALYAVFAAGRAAALGLLPFAKEGIERVYALRSGVPLFRIVLLITLLIGPGEEIFWRGFFQENAGAGPGRTAGFILASLLYTSVHLASGNIMLILAAAVCGVFWGWLYMRYRSPLLNIVSHTVWDLLVFVLFPL